MIRAKKSDWPAPRGKGRNRGLTIWSTGDTWFMFVFQYRPFKQVKNYIATTGNIGVKMYIHPFFLEFCIIWD